MSTHNWEQPALFNLHSSRPHLSTGSSSASGQSWILSHTFDKGMHIPSPQSNSVLRLHERSAAAVNAKIQSKNSSYSTIMLTAIQLVTSIFTFSLAWTVKATMNACFVSTLKLIRSTCDILAERCKLIIIVRTILLAITWDCKKVH